MQGSQGNLILQFLYLYDYPFSRRYGEVRYGQVSVSVTKNTNLDYTTLTSTNKTTTTEISTTTTTTTTTENGYFNYPIKRPFAIHRTKEEEEIYQRNFLILKVIVRVTVVLTLISLAAAFGVLYFHNWRMWDQSLPGASCPPAKIGARNILDDSDEDTDEELYQEIDPMLKRKLVATRRKSVAFSVCVVDRENMTFDLESKRVMLGLTRSTDRLPSVLPTLQEDCESEKMGQSIPLIIPPPGSGTGVLKTGRFNSTRRMSVPAVCLTKILHHEDDLRHDRVKMFTSSETII